MCGIAGISGLHDRSVLERMVTRLKHRGPDGQGIETFAQIPNLGPVGLGHARLAIIDLSDAGRQPMCNEDGTVWVVFNGEIYNFQEVRRELEQAGHRFSSRTDSEVIVHGFEEWGPACVNRLNGMFAFAVLDKHKGSLTLVRDRLGIKPLYYAKTACGLAFASEAKALLEHPELPARIDPESLDLYLALGFVPGPRSMFRGISRLQPGTILEYGSHGLTLTTYWTIPPHDPVVQNGYDWPGELYELLVDAVRMQLISDVPLGAFLSGGLDSSVITSIMVNALQCERVQTFCLGFEGPVTRHDERHEAHALSRVLGTRHQDALCTREEAVNDLARLVWHLDEPIAEDVLPGYRALCRKARENVTVVLTGEGSDEFNYGYRFYALEGLRRRGVRVPSVVRKTAMAMVSSKRRTFRKKALQYCLSDDEITAFVHWSSVFRPEERRALYGDTLSTAPQDDLVRWLQSRCAERSEYGVDLIACLDAQQRLVDYLLLRADRMSMAFGLEARVPFLDHRVVEFLSRVPAAAKIRRLKGKMVLRRAVQDILPSENTWRRKKPFAAPINNWLPAAAAAYLGESRLVADGVLRRTAVDGLLCVGLSDSRAFSVQIWAVVMLEVWYRVFIRQDVGIG